MAIGVVAVDVAEVHRVGHLALERARLAATRGGATSRDGAISRPAWSNSFSPRASDAEVAFMASRRSHVAMFHTNSRVSMAKLGGVLHALAGEGEHRRRAADGVEEAVRREVHRALGAQGRHPADRARGDGRLERVVREQRPVAEMRLVEDHGPQDVTSARPPARSRTPRAAARPPRGPRPARRARPASRPRARAAVFRAGAARPPPRGR